MKLTAKLFRTVLASLSFVLLVGSAAPVLAATNQTSKPTNSEAKDASGNGSAKAYDSDGQADIGSIVQIDPKDSNRVLIATKQENKLIYGVVIDPHLLSLTISSIAFKHQVYVATTGSYNVMVSDEGGTIEPGDYITVSSINGVGMDVDGTGAQVIGQAVRAFDGKTDSTGKVDLKDKSGKTIKTVNLGVVPVNINIQVNPNKQSTKTNLPDFLERTGQAIADKPVSNAKLYISAAIVLLSVIVSLTIMYIGIRKGMISIGRNPLSKGAVYRGMAEVIISGMLILVIGMFAVYLLLKL